MGEGTHTITITGIAAGGAGVGRLPDGRVCFVHRTAPGDTARVQLTEEKPRWTRGRLVELEAAGPGRREAPCAHYQRGCGGCTLEHLEYEAQLEAKSQMIADALGRIGKRVIEPPEVVPSPREFRYRNRVTFTLRRGAGTEAGVRAGFHELEAPDRLVDIGGDCLLPEEPIAEAWSRLLGSWGPEARRLPSGDELRLTLRASSTGAVSLAIDGGYAPGRPEELLQAVPDLEAVWHRPAGAREFRLLAGDAALREQWAGETLEVSGDLFTQVNREGAQLLEAHVMERVLAARPERVLDAYCGAGLYARRLVREGVAVVGIESHPGAVEEARQAAPEARIVEGRVEDHLEAALPADLAIVNPPRAGLGRAVTEALGERPPRRLVYVSCDPATLARDLKRLGDRFELRGVRGFDLFPQTSHVETVVEAECVIS